MNGPLTPFFIQKQLRLFINYVTQLGEYLHHDLQKLQVKWYYGPPEGGGGRIWVMYERPFSTTPKSTKKQLRNWFEIIIVFENDLSSKEFF